MALIICPECGKEISDTVKRCPHCGYKKAKKSKSKKALLFLLVILIIVGGGFGGYYIYENVIVPSKEYKQAESLVKKEKYEKAIKEFELLGDYKDSKEQIKEIKYTLASESNYDDAIKLYGELGDYKDSKQLLEEAESEKAYQDASDELEDAYEGCISSNTTLSSDNTSITVDSTNQFDFVCLDDITHVITCLKLPDSLLDEMNQTNSLMGRQTETYDFYTVTWSYHPDNGLDVIFKLNEK